MPNDVLAGHDDVPITRGLTASRCTTSRFATIPA
jgi:hypothetical protein